MFPKTNAQMWPSKPQELLRKKFLGKNAKMLWRKNAKQFQFLKPNRSVRMFQDKLAKVYPSKYFTFGFGFQKCTNNKTCINLFYWACKYLWS